MKSGKPDYLKMSPESEEDAHGKYAAKRAKGGKVDGKAPKMRLDRRARGGKVNAKGTKVNVIVMPQGGGAPAPMPMGPPPGAMPPPTMVPPPKPPMMVAGGAPGMMPPGGMPPPGPMRARGGSVNSSIKMRYGSGGEKGREEKIEKYGANAKSGEGK